MNLYFRALKYIKPYLFVAPVPQSVQQLQRGGTRISAFDYQGYGGPGFKKKRRSDAQLYRYAASS